MTHVEIGKALGMTTVQVANVLRRLKGRANPINPWLDALDADLYNK